MRLDDLVSSFMNLKVRLLTASLGVIWPLKAMSVAMMGTAISGGTLSVFSKYERSQPQAVFRLILASNGHLRRNHSRNRHVFSYDCCYMVFADSDFAGLAASCATEMPEAQALFFTCGKLSRVWLLRGHAAAY